MEVDSKSPVPFTLKKQGHGALEWSCATALAKRQALAAAFVQEHNAHAEELDHDTRPILVTGLCTAMRRGDCCLLKWADVDLARRERLASSRVAPVRERANDLSDLRDFHGLGLLLVKPAPLCNSERRFQNGGFTGHDRKPEAWMSLTEIAEHLQVRTDTVHRWVRAGKAAGKTETGPEEK